MAKLNSSKIFNQIVSPFTWYDNPFARNEYKKHCQGECAYKLLTPGNALLPFMLVRQHRSDPIKTWKVFNQEGVEVGAIDLAYLHKKTILDKDYFFYLGDPLCVSNELREEPTTEIELREDGGIELREMDADTCDPLACGYYYSEISDGKQTWYSELFYVTPSLCCGPLLINGNLIEDLHGWTTIGSVNWVDGAKFGGLVALTALAQAIYANAKVKVSFVIVGATQGTLKLTIGDAAPIGLTSTDGQYTFFGNTGASGTIGFSSEDGFDGTIEIVQVCDATRNCSIQLQWGADCDFGNIYYGGGFINKFLFDTETEIGEPSYKITKETRLDGDTNPVETLKKRQKIYHIETGPVPEYIVDALIDMSIHPIKQIFLPNCVGYEDIKDVTVTPAWLFDEKCFANVKIEFAINEIVEKGCCEELSESDCIPACYIVNEEIPDQCFDGQYYINDGGDVLKCNNGVLEIVECESGYVQTKDGTLLYYDGAVWVEIPMLLSIEPVDAALQTYKVKYKIPNGSVGKLLISNSGNEQKVCVDADYTDTGIELSSDEWENDGAIVELPIENTTCWNRCMKLAIINCDYPVSSPALTCCMALSKAWPDKVNFTIPDELSRIYFQDGSYEDVNITLTDPEAIETFLNGLALPGYTDWSVKVKHVIETDGDEYDEVHVSVCTTDAFDPDDTTTVVDHTTFFFDNGGGDTHSVDVDFTNCTDGACA